MNTIKEVFEIIAVGILLYIGYLALMYVDNGQGFTVVIRFIMMSVLFLGTGFGIATIFARQL